MNSIRRAQEKDIPGILKLLLQVDMVHHRGRPDIFKGPATKYDAEQLKEIIKDDNTPVFVCLDDEENVLGHAFCVYKQALDDRVLTDIRTLYIDDICVDEKARRQQVGADLYRFVIDHARENGFYNVTLNAWSCNPAAIKFYEKMGMSPQKIGMEVVLERKGRLYGVGVGPGDPELLTVKALRLIARAEIIAVPGEEAKKSAAYRIAVQAAPEIRDKKVIALPMPMTKDRAKQDSCHGENAKTVEEYLNRGENVVFLTLGDPNIYSTFCYLREKVIAAGYEVESVSGIMSLSSVASRLNLSLADGDEEVHIIPASSDREFDFSGEGTYIIMKPRGQIEKIRSAVKSSGKTAKAVSNCGMDDERVYDSIDDLPGDTGYFTVIIVK